MKRSLAWGRDVMSCRDCPDLGRRQFLLATAAAPAALTPLSASANEARYAIPGAAGATIDKGRQVILVRENGSVCAFALSCPHENTALKWRARDHRFQCPRHESKYTPDGTFTSGRATRNMDRFPVTRDDDQIVVDLTKGLPLGRRPRPLAVREGAALTRRL